MNTAEERSSLDWFVTRTSKKIPGIFTLALWESVVIPVSLSESAVLHALLSVSYAHYNGTLKVEQDTKYTLAEADSEQLLLRHYVKSTQELSCSTASQANVRITLISCLLFAYLECLRGHFRTAQAHVFGGLRISQQWQCNTFISNQKNQLLSSVLLSNKDMDDWIAQAFSRLYVQICLLNPKHVEPVVLTTLPRIPVFADINEAWRSLEVILCNVTALEYEFYSRGNNCPVNPSQRQRQRCLAEDLSWWQRVFDASSIHDQNDPRKALAGLVLPSYHTMAVIMIETCLSRDQMQYDQYTQLFLRILCYGNRCWSSRSPQRLPGHLLNMPRSIVDIGWMPPLYYTAIHCRHHAIRSHAIRLLESTSHREGFWDVHIAAAVARTVMQIEECERHQPAATKHWPLDRLPNLETCRTTGIRAEQRVLILEVILPDRPEENPVISFQHEGCQKECAIFS
jgi:hypothetical protein